MKYIGELIARDLNRKIEEIIQVDQADEESVQSVLTAAPRTSDGRLICE